MKETQPEFSTPEGFKAYVSRAINVVQARARHDVAIKTLKGYPPWYLPEIRHSGWFARLLQKLGGDK